MTFFNILYYDFFRLTILWLYLHILYYDFSLFLTYYIMTLFDILYYDFIWYTILWLFRHTTLTIFDILYYDYFNILHWLFSTYYTMTLFTHTIIWVFRHTILWLYFDILYYDFIRHCQGTTRRQTGVVKQSFISMIQSWEQREQAGIQQQSRSVSEQQADNRIQDYR